MNVKDIQLFVHKNYDQIKLFLLFVLVVFGALTLVNLGRAVEEIKQDNARNHARTQQYIRCIANTILVPLAERDDIDFDNCSNTKTDADDNPRETGSTQTAPPPQGDATQPPRVQTPTAVEPRPPRAPSPMSVARESSPVAQVPDSTQQRGYLPTFLDGATGLVGDFRGVLGL